MVKFVSKDRLDNMSETKKHQGVIAYAAAYNYATVEDILAKAEENGEPPFIFLLDGIEDPHNLGAIIVLLTWRGHTVSSFRKTVPLV